MKISVNNNNSQSTISGIKVAITKFTKKKKKTKNRKYRDRV